MPVTPSSRISSKKAAISAANETGGTEKCMVTLPGKVQPPSSFSQLPRPLSPYNSFRQNNRSKNKQ